MKDAVTVARLAGDEDRKAARREKQSCYCVEMCYTASILARLVVFVM